MFYAYNNIPHVKNFKHVRFVSLNNRYWRLLSMVLVVYSLSSFEMATRVQFLTLADCIWYSTNSLILSSIYV